MSLCESQQLSAPPTVLPPEAFRGAAADDASSRVQIQARTRRDLDRVGPGTWTQTGGTRNQAGDKKQISFTADCSRQASVEDVEAEQSDVTQGAAFLCTNTPPPSGLKESSSSAADGNMVVHQVTTCSSTREDLHTCSCRLSLQTKSASARNPTGSEGWQSGRLLFIISSFNLKAPRTLHQSVRLSSANQLRAWMRR